MLNWCLFTFYLLIGWFFHRHSLKKVAKDHKGQKDEKEVVRFMKLFQAPIIFFWPFTLAWAMWVKYLPEYFRWKEKQNKH